jgi:integrase/recombinase XerD
MTIASNNLQHTGISSDNFTLPTIESLEECPKHPQHESYSSSSIETLHKILRRLAGMDLPGKEHAEAYLRHLARRNRRSRTLYSNMSSIVQFLGMLRDNGRGSLVDLIRGDVEAFIEHEQDRGIKITTIRTRLVCIHAFLRYLVGEGIVSQDVFDRRIRLQLPEHLPRAMDPDDLMKLLSVIDHICDRAMILVLLRTGMRIGELLNTKVIDIHLKERKIEIYEGEKNRLGRVVYLSDDAVGALKSWLSRRDPQKEYLIYAQGKNRMSYSTARLRFVRYLLKADLSHKGYTVHTLRHTFATELLNAGMRLECLQVLLGHRCIEETRRYARLTDKTREEEYFRAMSRIERGSIHGDDRHDHALAAIFEKEELLTEHR